MSSPTISLSLRPQGKRPRSTDDDSDAEHKEITLRDIEIEDENTRNDKQQAREDWVKLSRHCRERTYDAERGLYTLRCFEAPGGNPMDDKGFHKLRHVQEKVTNIAVFGLPSIMESLRNEKRSMAYQMHFTALLIARRMRLEAEETIDVYFESPDYTKADEDLIKEFAKDEKLNWEFSEEDKDMLRDITVHVGSSTFALDQCITETGKHSWFPIIMGPENTYRKELANRATEHLILPDAMICRPLGKSESDGKLKAWLEQYDYNLNWEEDYKCDPVLRREDSNRKIDPWELTDEFSKVFGKLGLHFYNDFRKP
ncbi:hypothetical protein K491DRAFT_679898 [Lophiostoma macrostomum CBS 122681]|uniref:SRR1-like domain-containing protein n=1 Tax=Lophiostoma macrostomum CBS 122681 TaxID=1314788 RepID=A0A6A6T3E3_9PLEO|nr:hypothetical protein K491DRAFT_679898 [Lophiostoma macrostomum CBS 122681]